MTRDQRSTLDKLRYHSRLRVIGGAGTGKTWLALEQARRLGRAGERVALVCYSRGLARWFERQTQTWPRKEQPAYVGLFHRLPVEWGAERAPMTTATTGSDGCRCGSASSPRRSRPADLFDSVVVDEGQDFGELWWPSLVTVCGTRPRVGCSCSWTRRSGSSRATAPRPSTCRRSSSDENIRNTKQIAQLFGAFGDARLSPRGLPGSPVRVVDVPDDDAIGAADDAVEALLDEGWEPGQIALLTTRHRHPEQRNAVDHGGWAAYWDDFFAGTDVFYGHVLGFKGWSGPPSCSP